MLFLFDRVNIYGGLLSLVGDVFGVPLLEVLCSLRI